MDLSRLARICPVFEHWIYQDCGVTMEPGIAVWTAVWTAVWIVA